MPAGSQLHILTGSVRGRSIVVLLCTLMTLALPAGCGYKFAGSSGNRLDSNHLLWVSFIANDTISPSAQTVLRRALLEEAHALRGIAPAGSATVADLLISGALRSYVLTVVSYSAADRAREYRLTIDVELELRRAGVGVPLWKGKLQAFQDYPANDDLALQRNAEEAALAAASKKLAQKLLTAAEQSY
jgi:outer membrane lipopolysaccharide assembly protein LptE/RlpB